MGNAAAARGSTFLSREVARRHSSRTVIRPPLRSLQEVALTYPDLMRRAPEWSIGRLHSSDTI